MVQSQLAEVIALLRNRKPRKTINESIKFMYYFFILIYKWDRLHNNNS